MITTRTGAALRRRGHPGRAVRRRQGRQPRGAAARRHPRARRLRGHDGGLPVGDLGPRPRSSRVTALDPADATAVAAACADLRARGRVGAAAGGGRRGGDLRLRRALCRGRERAAAGRGALQRHERGFRRCQLRRPAGHLPVGARRRRGGRAGPPLLGEPLQRRVGDLPAAAHHPRAGPGHGGGRPADGRLPQLRASCSPGARSPATGRSSPSTRAGASARRWSAATSPPTRSSSAR